MMEKQEEAVMLSASLIRSEYRRQHLNSATCSSNNSEYDKYESNTSSEYNLSEYMYTNRCSGTSTQSNTSTSTQSNTSASSDEDNKEELSSSSIFVSGYDKVNFPDIPPPSRQNESTGSSHLHYNETQPGSKTKKKTKPLYKEKSNNKHKRDVLILPNITLKENEPIKTSIINNNKPNANKRKNMSEKIDKREGKQIYGVKQSDLSLLDDSSDDEAVRQYYERQKSKHRPGGARRRCRERENTFYESNEAMCYDVSSNARRHEAEPVSLPALDNLAGIPDKSRESRKKDNGFGLVILPAIPQKQIVTPQRGDLKRSKKDRIAQSLNKENMMKDVTESKLELNNILRVDKKECHKKDKTKKENPTEKKKSEKLDDKKECHQKDNSKKEIKIKKKKSEKLDDKKECHQKDNSKKEITMKKKKSEILDGPPPKNKSKNAVDQLESLTVYQLLEAIPGVMAKTNTKKMMPNQLTSHLPKLDVMKLSMLDRKLTEDSEEKTSKYFVI